MTEFQIYCNYGVLGAEKKTCIHTAINMPMQFAATRSVFDCQKMKISLYMKLLMVI